MTVANLPARTTSQAVAVTVIDGELVTPPQHSLAGDLGLLAYTGTVIAGSAALGGLPAVAAGVGGGAALLAGVALHSKRRKEIT